LFLSPAGGRETITLKQPSASSRFARRTAKYRTKAFKDMSLSGEQSACTVKPSDEQVSIEADSCGEMNFRLRFVHHKLFTEEYVGAHVTLDTKNA
jgi:hypothetical protein